MNVYLLPISVAQQKYIHLNILFFISFFSDLKQVGVGESFEPGPA